MSKNRTPALADWLVVTATGAAETVRASALHIRDGCCVLSDTYGHPLFAAPLGAVCCVRRLEPGEKAPEPRPVPVPALAEPAPLADLVPPEPPAPADPGPIEVTPAPRPRTTRRGK